ncbi:MAG: hypothetical protein K2Q03_04055, partial [Sphingobacteriaceae bacterium]|nr:hypothetical protein [Sphingobacteriaceae bacterium]
MNNYKITLEFTRGTDSDLSTAAGIILGDVQQQGNYYDFIAVESQALQSQLIEFNALLQQCSSGDKNTIEKKNNARVPLVATLKTMAAKIDLQNQTTQVGDNEYIIKSGF